jgi:putative molybdopterin biosynthesis protein
MKIAPDQISGYAESVKTHSEAALAISTNLADVALGLQAAAKQHELGFIPLFEERYDLILPRENEKILSPLLDYLQTSAFRSSLGRLVGYNSTHSGEQIVI